MKPLLFISLVIAAPIFMTSCNQEELAKSNKEVDSLMVVINERDSAINSFIFSFNEVEIKLDSVTAKQNIIRMNKSNGDLKEGQRDRINAEIEAINNLMEENRKTIAELGNKLKKFNRKNSQLERIIATLNRQFFQKNLELTTLNDELSLLNLQVAKLQTTLDTLSMQNFAQSTTIMEKNKELHTAYYIVGKSKELQDAKLIDKHGGLLGIGRTEKLNSNIDNSKFFRIDYTKISNIPIHSNNAKIITSHPSDSYTLNKDTADNKMIASMQIINPEKFWSASKYLVIINN